MNASRQATDARFPLQIMECDEDKDEFLYVEGLQEIDSYDVGSKFSVLDENEVLAEISFNTILGKSVGATMELKGSIFGMSVLILVDNGSTHDFILADFVAQLKIPCVEISSFVVQTGNGDMIRCHRLCKSVEVIFPRLSICEDFYHFSLKGTLLGIKWLAFFNIAQANWNEMFLIFKLGKYPNSSVAYSFKGESWGPIIQPT